MSFIGQISTGEVIPSAPCPGLPADSLLWFFYDAEGQRGWGFDPADHQYWQVVAVPRATAVPVEAPSGVPVFSPHELVPEPVTTIPDQWEPLIEELWNADRDAVNGLYEELDGGSGDPRHRMFGWPDLVQNPMHWNASSLPVAST